MTPAKYLDADLCVLPANRIQKRPTVPWKKYQTTRPTAQEVDTWFSLPADCCLICGAVSGNLELLDFDFHAEFYPAWSKLLEPDLLARLVVEKSQSGGLHVVYRCEEPIEGSQKLARRDKKTFIETRGEGGLFLCHPTPGYDMVTGDLTKLPVLTLEERDQLIKAAKSLDGDTSTGPTDIKPPSSTAVRPGDDYCSQHNCEEVLIEQGWTQVKGGDNEYWRRPGKNSGHSATLKNGLFFVFSSNAHPLESEKSYNAFALFAEYYHGGDYSAAAADLRRQGFGPEVDLSELVTPALPELEDPGPIPMALLRVPGFISEVMDLALESAPYPNQAMAFCGALALQSFLAGRKVRDPGDNRTNLYLLGLAHSAAGKDWPRKLNARILHSVGLSDQLGDRFASGEGIQDAMTKNPCMLFQTDEIDGMLQSITRSHDARHESIISTLLTMYSASNSVFPARRKAGFDRAQAIEQPCLTIFGTAIPNCYYEALSERMLTNGFFARMLTIESGPRSEGQEPRIVEVPRTILEVAAFWANLNPEPILTVQHTPDAKNLLIATRHLADAEYKDAEKVSDPVGTTVWGRVSEHVRKLALVYACSDCPQAPEITSKAVSWATALVEHQTRRMLVMASRHSVDGVFHGLCLKLKNKLREAPDNALPHSLLLKRMRLDSKTFAEVIKTLEESGEVETLLTGTKGRIHRSYKMASGKEVEFSGV